MPSIASARSICENEPTFDLDEVGYWFVAGVVYESLRQSAKSALPFFRIGFETQISQINAEWPGATLS